MALTGLLGTPSSRPGDIQPGNPGTAAAGPPQLVGSSAGRATVSGTLLAFHIRQTQAVLVVLETDLGLVRVTQIPLVVLLTIKDLGLASASGQATTSATLTKPKPLTGSCTGQATTSGTLRYAAVTRPLASTVSARATATAILGKLRRLSGVTHGIADLPRIRIKLTKPKMLTGSTAGRATAAISLLGKRRALAGTTSGRATVGVTLSARRALAGRTDGLATVTTYLYRPPRRDVFLGIATSTGRATVSLVWGFRRDLVGSSPGSATVTVLGFGQARELVGIVPGVGTTSAWLALAPVVLPLVPAETFTVCVPRRIVYCVHPRQLVYSAPPRELTFSATREE